MPLDGRDRPRRTVRLLPPNRDNNARGAFLEEVAADLLRRQRYQVSKRVRFTGMEIDVLAEHRDTKQRLLAECKFTARTVSANVIDLVMGKALRHGVDFAYLFSTSELSRSAVGVVADLDQKALDSGPRFVFIGPEQMTTILMEVHGSEPSIPHGIEVDRPILHVASATDPFWVLEEALDGVVTKVYVQPCHPLDLFDTSQICNIFESHGIYEGVPVEKLPLGSGRRGTVEDCINVLLIEDEDAHAQIIVDGCNQVGSAINLVVVGSLAEARAYLSTSRPDVVLADLLLPDGRGTDLLLEEGRSIPIVIITSHGNELLATEAMRQGAVDYLVKSAATLSSVPETVKKALRLWRDFVEDRMAIDELLDRERFFQELVDGWPGIVFVVDELGFVSYVNARVSPALGYCAEDLIGEPFGDLIGDSDKQRVQDFLKECFTQMKKWQMVRFSYLHQDRSLKCLETIVRFDSLNDPKKVVLYSRVDLEQAS